MSLKPQTSFFAADLRAMGVPLLDSTGLLSDPNAAAGNLVYPMGLAPQLASPLTGATVVIPDGPGNALAYVTPAGTIAALTLTLPSDANSKLLQECAIVTSQAITALTINQAGGGATILGAAAGLAAGASLNLVKVAANTWAKI